MPANPDADYLEIVLRPIRVCASYRPKMGHGSSAAYSLGDFRNLYGADPFYAWLGLDDPLMYAAHKAAGGMTSIYRQIGIGCEALFRRVLADQFDLTDEQVKWSYTVPAPGGRQRTLSLDGRLAIEDLQDSAKRTRVKEWLLQSATAVGVDPRIRRSLKGVVFEIRQGYKSKDSKRQNADIANAASAYAGGYLPCAGILSTQIDSDILLRYRGRKWVVLTGLVGDVSSQDSIYSFMREVVGYDLAAFFERNKSRLRAETHSVLVSLLAPS